MERNVKQYNNIKYFFLLVLELAFIGYTHERIFKYNVNINFEHYSFPTNIKLLHGNTLIFNNNSTHSLSSCKLCSFVVRQNKPNSTPRDVIIAASVGKAVNIVVFLKSLRTTGSKAQCVFLVDSVAFRNISSLTKKIVEQCGGRIIDCGDVPYNKPFDGHNYCYILALSFLTVNRNTFDRVIICDMFDTVFQGDPFTQQFSSDKLNIIDEGARFNNEFTGPTNREWLKPFNIIIRNNSQVKYLCTGYMGASTEIMIKTLKLFAMQHKFGEGRHDQAAFNYLYLSRTLIKNGIYTVGRRENEEVRHLAIVRTINKTLGYIKSINSDKVYATVIHHYYTDNLFRKSILEFCPKEYPELENYICEKKSFFMK